MIWFDAIRSHPQAEGIDPEDVANVIGTHGPVSALNDAAGGSRQRPESN